MKDGKCFRRFITTWLHDKNFLIKPDETLEIYL